MLYISRFGTNGYLYVKDTEDGVEDCITLEELHKYVADIGVVIRGVKTGIDLNGDIEILDIKPYTPLAGSATACTKLRVMTGVDVKVSDDIIYRIDRSDNLVKDRTIRVKLSQCGTHVGEKVLSLVLKSATIVLVLDDNITISAKSFNFIGQLNTFIDITAVTRQDTVAKVYNMMIKQCPPLGKEEALSRVIDTEFRKKVWRAVFLINFGPESMENLEELCNSEEIANEVLKIYGARFKAQVGVRFDPYTGHEPALQNTRISLFHGCKHFEPVTYEQAIDSWYLLFSSMGYHTHCNLIDLRCLGHYCQYLKASDVVKADFLDLYNRASKYIFDNFRELR